MFRINRIIIVLISIFIIFSLSACNKQNSFIGISKVEITCNLYTEVPRLEIYVFTTTDYENLILEKTKFIKEVNSYKSDVKLIKENKEIPGYLHLFHITFEKKEFIIQNLTFSSNKKEIVCPIGLFQTLLLEPSTIDIDTSINIYMDKDLTGLLNIHNKLYNDIYLVEQKVVTIKKKQTLEPFILDKIGINTLGIKSIDIFSINPKEKYHQIGGIVQSRFKTNLDEHLIYTTYYYNNMPNLNYLSSEGIDISSLEEIKNS